MKGERERGGKDRERSTSRDSDSGHPKSNVDKCRHAAHEAIGIDTLSFCTLFKIFSASNQSLDQLGSYGNMAIMNWEKFFC